MSRRFVHLVVNHNIRGWQAYKLCLIDPSRFFYPMKPSNGSAGDSTAREEFQLPPEAMTFYGPCCQKGRGYMDFMPLGQGNNKSIIGLDRKCRTIHCDAASLAVGAMPAAHAPKILPISVPVGDSLYVLQRNLAPWDHHCFEALIYGEGPESRFFPDWYWHSLPPPPHVNDSSYDESLEEDYTPNEIDGHALIGGLHIWVSTTKHAATYSFSTVTGTWSKVANWAMPFSGRAEYVPELNLWLGFSSRDNQLCATDLAAATALQPPEVIGQWDDVAQPEEWIPVTSNIVPLGSGKMFIAKFF